MTLEEQCTVLSEVKKKNPRITAKGLKGSYIPLGMPVCQLCFDAQQGYWRNVLWTGETKVEFFGKNKQHRYGLKKGTIY